MFSGLILLCFVMCVSSSQYESILTEVSSASSPYRDEKCFSKFDLNAVPQFGALCNIETPNINQVKLLLEYNVVPILCMGLYDATLRLCKTALNDNYRTDDIFPPTTEKFRTLFERLEADEKYSSLDTFCSSTTGNYIITTPSSNVSKEWWSVLNEQLNTSDTCKSLCYTSENNKVQPLCSFILWSNGIYTASQKSELEKQTIDISVQQENVDSTNILDEPKKEPEEPTKLLPPADQNDLSPTEAKTQTDSRSKGTDLEQIVPNPPLQGVNATSANLTVTSGSAFVPENEKLPITTQETNQGLTPQAVALKPVQDTSIIIADSNSNNTSKINPIKKNPGNKKKQLKEKLPGKDKSLKADEKGMKAPGSSNSGEEKQQTTKPKTEKEDAMVDGDLNLLTTQEEVVGSEQPIGSDKDQQQYLDEDQDDEDGDDVDMPESPLKTVPNKTDANKASVSQPIIVPSDQGVADLDGEILIEDHFIEAEDSHFFTYFLCLAVLVILFYLAFYNKKKLVALAIEGRRTKHSKRRPNCSNYSKLDCSLEEAMVSNKTASVTHVLY